MEKTGKKGEARIFLDKGGGSINEQELLKQINAMFLENTKALSQLIDKKIAAAIDKSEQKTSGIIEDRFHTHLSANHPAPARSLVDGNARQH